MIDDSESEVEEDPDFPLPTSYSDDEDDQGSPLPIVTCTHPPTPSTQSLQGKTTLLHYTKHKNTTRSMLHTGATSETWKGPRYLFMEESQYFTMEESQYFTMDGD